MLGLLRFHEIAARRGDGLLPELFSALAEQPPRETLKLIPGGLAQAGQPPPAFEKSREPSASS